MIMNRECECGAVVSDQFARVYGDNDGTVHHCIECLDERDGGRTLLRSGAGAISDLDVVKDRV